MYAERDGNTMLIELVNKGAKVAQNCELHGDEYEKREHDAGTSIGL
jgi:hypothetical protein